MRRHLAPWLLLAWLPVAGSAGAQCVGDCGGDGAVSVAELLLAVNVALGLQPATVCPGLANGAGQVDVARLVQAVGAALDGCAPPAPPSASPSASPTPTPTLTIEPPTASPTPTPGPNFPPALPAPFLYRAFAGQPIALPLAPVDPEGGGVRCAADGAPDGLTLDADNVLRWTPDAAHLGPRRVPFTCTDDGAPPAAVDGEVHLHVADDGACVTPSCDAALGCTGTPPPAAIGCCEGGAAPRVPASDAPCPLGAWLEVGRNFAGIGPLHDCDRLRIRTFEQAGAETALHVRARCLRADERVTVTVRLQAHPRGFAVDATSTFLPAAPVDGVIERRNLRFAISGGGPFFDLGEEEANLTVTLRDADGVIVSRTLRVRLTFSQLADLPD